MLRLERASSPPPVPLPGHSQPLLPPSPSRPAPSSYVRLRAETRRNHCPSQSSLGWLQGCPCPLLSCVGCPGVILALWIILAFFRASCLISKWHPRREGRRDSSLSHLPGIPMSWGDWKERGHTAMPLILSSLRGTATSPGTTACSRRRCTTSEGCASSSACPPTPLTHRSGVRRRWVPLGISRGARYSYGHGTKPPSLFCLTKPLLLSPSSWASTWTGRCTPWWCTRWWMKERVRRGFLAGLGLPSCWHCGASPCTKQAETPASPCCCHGPACPLSPACLCVSCRAHRALPCAAGHL